MICVILMPLDFLAQTEDGFFFSLVKLRQKRICPKAGGARFDPGSGKIPWRGMATPSVIAQRIPWTEDSGGYSPQGHRENRRFLPCD